MTVALVAHTSRPCRYEGLGVVIDVVLNQDLELSADELHQVADLIHVHTGLVADRIAELLDLDEANNVGSS